MYKVIILVAMVAFLSINTNVANATTGANAKQHSICELMTGEDLLEDTQAFLKENRYMFQAHYARELKAPLKNGWNWKPKSRISRPVCHGTWRR